MTFLNQKTINTALTVAAILLAWDLMVILQDWYTSPAGAYSPFINLMTILFGLLMVMRSLYGTKRKEPLRFGQRFGVGLLFSSVVAVVYGLGCLLLYKVIFSSSQTDAISSLSDQMLIANATDAQIERQIIILNKAMSIQGILIFKCLITWLQGLFLGLVVGGIIGNGLESKEKQFNH